MRRGRKDRMRHLRLFWRLNRANSWLDSGKIMSKVVDKTIFQLKIKERDILVEKTILVEGKIIP